MDQEALEHLSRIGTICDKLLANPSWAYSNSQEIIQPLSDFDAGHWNFIKYLSLSLYSETASLLHDVQTAKVSRPEIAVVMAVYKPDAELLRRAVASALNQVGVSVKLYLSLDGPEGNRELVERVLSEIPSSERQVLVLSNPTNRGVGLCRNAALQLLHEDWFTFLDCDDIFHPLRCLHSWLALQALGVQRLNTGYSRVCLREGKIVLLQQSLTAVGGNSFLACSSLLGSYGYLAPLRFYEDTEYENRLTCFGVPINNCSAVGHYQNTGFESDYCSLGVRWRKEAHAITGHPWLCGTTMGSIDLETQMIRGQHYSIYQQTSQDELAERYKAEGG